MSWMQTYTGGRFWPLEPKVTDVRLEDIAHSLSNKCRFNGHCRTFYSIAQHSVHVADALRNQLTNTTRWTPYSIRLACRAALLHDAAEAYLPDIIRPIKPAWKEFINIEIKVLKIIFETFGIPFGFMAVVHFHDDVLLATEKRDLMVKSMYPWEKLPYPLPTTIEPMNYDQAKQFWLSAWYRNLNWKDLND